MYVINILKYYIVNEIGRIYELEQNVICTLKSILYSSSNRKKKKF